MKFKNLKIKNWKQFEELDIDFHPNLTMLTGANGSGKTTILNILARHFGWNLNELATPRKNRKTGFFSFINRLLPLADKNKNDPSVIGRLEYNNSQVADIRIPYDGDTPQYNISISGMQPVKGLNVPSHRPVFFYQNVPHVPTQKRTKEDAFNLSWQSAYEKVYSNNNSLKTPNYYIKETLLSWAMAGNGNEFIEPDPELRNYFIEFQEILKQILPNSLGFTSISIRNYEIILITKTGEFMLDAVSGGISAIIDLGWQVFNYSDKNKQSISVLIDEVENHLHATLQRSILPSMIAAFPNVQFIVSTHSPLIIGSVKDSNVYAFRYNQNNKIYNQTLDLVNKAKNANEILNEVLGVPFTMPIWVEDSINEIVRKYSESDISPDIFKAMRGELKELGLEDLMPIAMDKTLEKLDDKN